MSDSKGWAMVFGFGRKDPRKDERADERHVPYRLATYEHDYEGKRFKSSNVVYSFWSASKYVLILSLILWWLPMFGQMIAGYVGGRRAGGPWKGVAATIIPVVCLWAVMTGFETGVLPSHVFGVAVAPAAIGTALRSGVPLIAPYIDFSSEYIGSFVESLAGSSPYGINTYVLTVAFAYVGGILAEQNRREIEFNSGAVMSNTTVLVADKNHHAAGYAVEEPHSRGVLAGIGSLLHLPGGSHPAVTGAHAVHRRRDAWARAAEMRYEDDGPEYDEDRMLPPARVYDVEMEDVSRGSRRTRKLKHRDDQWYHHKQKRRGRPNYSAKPRFGYPQYETDSPRPDNSYGAVVSRRSKKFKRFDPNSSQNSSRRAKRMMDKDWGHRKYPRLVQYDDGPPEAEEEVEAEPVVHPRREHRSAHDWDSI